MSRSIVLPIAVHVPVPVAKLGLIFLRAPLQLMLKRNVVIVVPVIVQVVNVLVLRVSQAMLANERLVQMIVVVMVCVCPCAKWRE